MRIVIAPDSFKECASAVTVASAIERGMRRAAPDDNIHAVPMADGGEGTVEALVTALEGRYIETEVTGPLGEPVIARYGLVHDGKTAVIEMASASGLPLVPSGKRNPGVTTTYGTGELINHALEQGVTELIIGLGGSATCDGGAGMAQALGFILTGEDGEDLEFGGLALGNLRVITPPERQRPMPNIRVIGACDVDNPLCGPSGTARVYAEQKGADAGMIDALDDALEHYAAIVEQQMGISIRDAWGAGAAGGLGAGLIAFLGAELAPGIEVVADACGLRELIKGADLVITGEGRMDRQSAHGKTPIGVARMAAAEDVPVIAIVGVRGEGAEAVYGEGVDAVFSICPGPITEEDAIANVVTLLEDTAETVARAWRAATRKQRVTAP